MLCENCGKRPATLHFTKIVNDQKNEYHLCEQCAKENEDMISENKDFSFHHLLSGLLNFDPMVHGHPVKADTDSLRCKTCGLTFSQFKRVGKFGCSDCYKYFEPQLEPIFRRVHGNSFHSGKVPVRTGTQIKLKKEINMLKVNLQQSVRNEEFEEAAKLRDKIKALELKLSERRD